MPSHRDTAERWRLRDLGPGDQVDGWRAVVADTHLPWGVDAAPVDLGRPFDAVVRRRRYAGVDVLDCRCDPCAGGRGRAELSGTDDAHVGVLAVVSGHEVLEQDGRQVDLHAGDVALWDSTRPAAFAVLTPLRKRTLLLPRAAVAAVPAGRGWTARRLPGDALPVRLLRAHLHALDRQPATTPEDATLVARITADLVAGCAGVLGTGREPTPRGPVTAARRAALRRAVEEHIARRLARVDRAGPLQPGELAPEAVAAAHAISLRALHQLFEDGPETLAGLVRRLRLERARHELRRGTATVTATAARWGFADASHFARAYRGQFGESPRETTAAVPE